MKLVCVFANRKGGVGKSASCLNLAFLMGGKLLDIDSQGTITTALRKNAELNLSHVFSNEKKIDQILLPVTDNLKIAPSDPALVKTEIELGKMKAGQREQILKNALAKTNGLVWIDTPPSLGLLVANALSVADFLIVPVQPQHADIRGLSLFLDTIETVKKRLNPNIEYKILLTFYDDRLNHHKQAVKILKDYKLPMFKTRISRSIRVAESMGRGLPVMEHDPGNKVSHQFLELASEVDRWQKTRM